MNIERLKALKNARKTERLIAQKIARNTERLYALYDDPSMTPQKARLAELAELSAKRLGAFIALIEAGKVHGQGPDAEVAEGFGLADVFSVRELTEEAERRALPPFRIGPPTGQG
jgi:hypothetical protein